MEENNLQPGLPKTEETPNDRGLEQSPREAPHPPKMTMHRMRETLHLHGLQAGAPQDLQHPLPVRMVKTKKRGLGESASWTFIKR